MLAVAYSQDHQRRKAIWILVDAASVDSLTTKLFDNEAAHVIRTDAGEQRRVQAEPGCTDRRIGRAAADIFGERGHVLEPSADLLAIQVNTRPTDGNKIKRLFQCVTLRPPLLLP